jgi:hypothetical protein
MNIHDGDCPETDEQMYKIIDKKEKTYKINSYHRGRERIVEGTLEYLTSYFGYTLECGHSWNPKINRNPKTLKSLISNINKSYHETMGSCYDPDYVSMI